ncbi:MAG: hypothetical protein HRT38_12215 [Alteromonadaceae bacterium]|nr:hypothetical protein [Alteromonadaceae bacterium]
MNLSASNKTEPILTGKNNKEEAIINNIVPNNDVTVSISKIGLALSLEFTDGPSGGTNGSGGANGGGVTIGGGANGGGNRPP